ncbi:MAG TPA: hypothetical protein VJH06_03370 [Candidatus Paceibacterota bacterium]
MKIVGNDDKVNLMRTEIDTIIDTWKNVASRPELDSMRYRILERAVVSVELQLTDEEIRTFIMAILDQDPSKMKEQRERFEFVEAVTAKIIPCRNFYKNAPEYPKPKKDGE